MFFAAIKTETRVEFILNGKINSKAARNSFEVWGGRWKNSGENFPNSVKEKDSNYHFETRTSSDWRTERKIFWRWHFLHYV